MQLRERKETFKNTEKQLRGTKDHLRLSNEPLIRGSIYKRIGQMAGKMVICQNFTKMWVLTFEAYSPELRRTKHRSPDTQDPGSGSRVPGRPTEPLSSP